MHSIRGRTLADIQVKFNRIVIVHELYIPPLDPVRCGGPYCCWLNRPWEFFCLCDSVHTPWTLKLCSGQEIAPSMLCISPFPEKQGGNGIAAFSPELTVGAVVVLGIVGAFFPALPVGHLLEPGLSLFRSFRCSSLTLLLESGLSLFR